MVLSAFLAAEFGCDMGTFPYKYPHMPLCMGLPTRISWYLVVERIDKKKLSS